MMFIIFVELFIHNLNQFINLGIIIKVFKKSK